jgi:cell division protease FtsH
MKKHQYTGFWILVGLIFLALFISTLFKGGGPASPSEPTYSEFISKVQNHEINYVEIEGNVAKGYTEPQAAPASSASSGTAVTTQPKASSEEGAAPANPVPASSASKTTTAATTTAPALGVKTPAAPAEVATSSVRVPKYKVTLPAEGGAGVQLLVPVLQRYNVPFTFHEPKAEGQWLGILTSFFLPLILFVFIFMLFRNAQGGGSQAMSFGKSRAKMSMDSKVKITFNDVAGIDEAKAELEEVVDFLKNGERYQNWALKSPKASCLWVLPVPVKPCWPRL